MVQAKDKFLVLRLKVKLHNPFKKDNVKKIFLAYLVVVSFFFRIPLQAKTEGFKENEFSAIIIQGSHYPRSIAPDNRSPSIRWMYRLSSFF